MLQELSGTEIWQTHHLLIDQISNPSFITISLKSFVSVIGYQLQSSEYFPKFPQPLNQI